MKFQLIQGGKLVLFWMPEINTHKTHSVNKLGGYYLNKRQKPLVICLYIHIYSLQYTRKKYKDWKSMQQRKQNIYLVR